MAQILMSHGEEPDPLDDTGLCLLSLDGGGVRGLSTLYILKGLMTRLNNQRQKSGFPSVKPCDLFDLIGGTSTGGLIAIMLGRLEMDVVDCIAAYSKLMTAVFKEDTSKIPINWKGKVKARFESKKLRSAIEQVISMTGASATDVFNDGKNRGCRTFVCSVAKETTGITRLRSYTLFDEGDIPATICEAALATSAATGFFDPVSIGARQFVDGALGANNPVEEVEGEAANIWSPETGDPKPFVKCFISIGTGNPGKKAIEDNMLKFLSKSLVGIATDTKETERKFIARWAKQYDENRYFRFSVDQGLQDIGLAEYKEQGKIEAVTDEYLNHQAQKFRVRDCVHNLGQKRDRTKVLFALAYEEYRTRRVIQSQKAIENAYHISLSKKHSSDQFDQNEALRRIEALLQASLHIPRNPNGTASLSEALIPVIPTHATSPTSLQLFNGKWLSRLSLSQLAQSKFASWLWFLGIDATLIKISRKQSRTYFLFSRWRIPSILSSVPKALAVDLELWISKLHGIDPRSDINIHLFNIVPDNAEIMIRCAQGDLDRVRTMFESGNAHPLDITSENRSPLWFAIESGNASLVLYLLRQNRKLVNMSFGMNSISPLQSALYERDVEMIRIFLTHGADADYIDSSGWSSLFHLLGHGRESLTAVTNMELMQIFSACGIIFDLSHQDIWGWTILQRLVIEGTEDELAAVMCLSHGSPDNDKTTLEEVMEAAAYAINLGMYSKFSALMVYVKEVDGPLRNGWTLLEISAYHGRDEITRCLLQMGAEEFYFDEPFFPSRLESQFSKAADLDDERKDEDEGWNVEQCSLYLKALIEYGRVHIHNEGQELGHDVEIYWDTLSED